jgi:Glycosyl transferase family 2
MIAEPNAETGRGTLSVVIPAYNRASTIAVSIESVLRQTRPVLEVVVVDDGSTDATVDVVRSFEDPRVRLISQANRGVSAARNTGIAAAAGDHIGFVDSDDLWLPGYAEAAMASLSTLRAPGFSYSTAYTFRGGTNQVAMPALGPAELPTEQGEILERLLRGNFLINANVVPSAVFAVVGMFDERFHMAEEYHLWIRILAAGYEAVWMGEPLVLCRHHENQATRQLAAMTQGVADVLADIDPASMPTESARELLRQSQRESAREALIATGKAGAASSARQLRHVLGRVRKRLGLTPGWGPPPPQLTDTFGEISRL